MIALDRYADLDSIIHRLDARSKIVGFVVPVLLIASTPRDQMQPFPAYFALLALLLVLSRVPVTHVVWRCAAAAPFIFMASALLLVAQGQQGLRPAASIALRASACVALLVLLTATSKFQDLLRAMKSLGAPEALNLIANLMFRYMFLLQEEYQRMVRARESRTAFPMRSGQYRAHARQFAFLFVRSWERAERVHAAMLARGYKGGLALPSAGKLRARDWLFPLASSAAFLAGRFMHTI